MGWEGKKDGIWFDADEYSKEEAIAQFKPFEGINKRGYPYTGYVYGGIKYYDFTYLGLFENNKMPKNDDDYYMYLLNK